MKHLTILIALLALSMQPATAQRKAKAKAKTVKLTPAEQERAQRLQQMEEATQRVVVFDSIVVSKEKLAETLRLSSESGRIGPYNDLFHSNEQPNTFAYINELGNKSYYALEAADGQIALHTSDKLDGTWSKPRALDGLETTESLTAMNYPYMMADGVTLYFAAKGEESIGGYDIFVTRYDASNDTFLKPENLGMPFNSPANDYLYAVDELYNIGWFVSDRGQTEGMVCVYLFVPTATRQTYADSGIAQEKLQSLARLASIADTWGDGTARKAALQRLEAALTASTAQQQKHDFTFIVDDTHTYTRLADFRSPQAKAKMEQLVKTKAKLYKLSQTLQQARNYYATAPTADQRTLRTEIMQSEQLQEELETSVAVTEKEIRNLEISTLKQ